MTGYESKRAAARDKLEDDRRAYYEKFDDLYAVYLNGVYDGKKAAQPAQEPVAWLCKADKNGLFGLPTADKACKDCFPVYAAPPQPAQEPVTWAGVDFDINTTPPQRPWVGLTEKEITKTYWSREPFKRPTPIVFAREIEQLLKEKNT